MPEWEKLRRAKVKSSQETCLLLKVDNMSIDVGQHRVVRSWNVSNCCLGGWHSMSNFATKELRLSKQIKIVYETSDCPCFCTLTAPHKVLRRMYATRRIGVCREGP